MFQTQRRKGERLDFVLAGAQKSGTTALHYFLSKHPDITMGDKQEMHFFDDEKIFAGPIDYELLHGHYPPVGGSTTPKASGLAKPFGVAGDCTPVYLYWNPAMERIWKYNPKIKLLILLRNPIDRAFAHWNMQRFKKREPLDFLEAVKAEKQRARQEAPMQSRRFSYIDRGLYAEQIERVFKFFPREQVKIVKSEEFQKDNRKTLDSIFEFLGVAPISISRNKDRNVVPYERAITAEEREYLRPVFADDIAKVEQMLEWDCTDWKV